MSVLLWLLYAVIAALGAFMLTPYIAERLRKPMNVEEERIKAPGEFAELPSGVTHYRWFGPEDGKIVVCVHGLSTPSFAYEAMAKGLAIKGWRVLTYDLYGRDYSDNPKGPQDEDSFLAQLDELLENQGVTGKFSLVGYSMGGMISAVFAARSPERIERLMLLASGGLQPVVREDSGIAYSDSYLSWWAAIVFGGMKLRQYIHAEKGARSIRDRQLKATRRRGYLPAVRSCIAHILTEDFEVQHRTIAEANIPVLAIWGKLDVVVPIAALGTLAQWNRAARQEVIEDASHALPYSHPARVALMFDTWARG